MIIGARDRRIGFYVFMIRGMHANAIQHATRVARHATRFQRSNQDSGVERGVAVVRTD